MPTSPSMRALVLDAANTPFREASLPRPAPAAGQVLVAIQASGVNPLDLKIRSGRAEHAQRRFHSISGMDLAGVVAEVGAGATGFAPGDEVFGLAGGVGDLQGSLAEFVAVDAALLAIRPKGLSAREAAAVPLTFITAWEGLVDRAGVQARQKVLIQGAGGVGRMAIQIARAYGAEVFATCRRREQALVEDLGATAIDAEPGSVEEYVADHTHGQGFDVVYDTIGGAALDASFRAVRRFGHVVSCLGWTTHDLAPLSFRAASYSGVFTLLPMLTGEGRLHHGDILREATKLIEAGRVIPHVDPRRFTFETIADAYAAVENRSARGKVIVEVGRLS